MMTVANAKRFVASRRARRSGIAAPLWHIWLPTTPLYVLMLMATASSGLILNDNDGSIIVIVSSTQFQD
jgi:hypothetical protein